MNLIGRDYFHSFDNFNSFLEYSYNDDEVDFHIFNLKNRLLNRM